MDIYITNDSTRGVLPQSKFFEPLSNKTPLPQTIDFYLIIANPQSDSSFTPGWDVPLEVLRVKSDITIASLFSKLREYLPDGTPGSDPPAPSSSSNSTGTSIIPKKRGLFGALRRPKLDFARVFLTRNPDGAVIPLATDDSEWHFKGGYTKTDLIDKTEMEWRLFKELIVAAAGQFKCYIAIKGIDTRKPFGKR